MRCLVGGFTDDDCTHVPYYFFFLMIRRPPRSTLDRSSAASDVYKRQRSDAETVKVPFSTTNRKLFRMGRGLLEFKTPLILSLIHISEPTRPY